MVRYDCVRFVEHKVPQLWLSDTRGGCFSLQQGSGSDGFMYRTSEWDKATYVFKKNNTFFLSFFLKEYFVKKGDL